MNPAVLFAFLIGAVAGAAIEFIACAIFFARVLPSQEFTDADLENHRRALAALTHSADGEADPHLTQACSDGFRIARLLRPALPFPEEG